MLALLLGLTTINPHMNVPVEPLTVTQPRILRIYQPGEKPFNPNARCIDDVWHPLKCKAWKI